MTGDFQLRVIPEFKSTKYLPIPSKYGQCMLTTIYLYIYILGGPHDINI